MPGGVDVLRRHGVLLRGGPRADYDAGAAADAGTDDGIARRVRQSGEFPILREWCFFSRCRVDEPPPPASTSLILANFHLSPHISSVLMNVRAFCIQGLTWAIAMETCSVETHCPSGSP